MNKKLFTLTSGIVVALSLVLAACVPVAAAAQSAISAVTTSLPSTLAAAAAQPAAAAEAIAQTAVAAVATAVPSTPVAAIAPSAVSGVSTALPANPTSATTQPNAAIVQTIPVFSGLQPLPATDPKAMFGLNTGDQIAKKTGEQFDGKAYLTNAKVADITTFYNDALKGWKATPPGTTSYPAIGNVTIWVYSQTSQQETLTIAYSAYDAAATKFLVITELLWK
ncbi:MAG TPA: hypothetical protein VKF38_04215 [Anaerolineaceae bacterium]|nr:hypothetical protein [Anaerolineaceae bacterium]